MVVLGAFVVPVAWAVRISERDEPAQVTPHLLTKAFGDGGALGSLSSALLETPFLSVHRGAVLFEVFALNNLGMIYGVAGDLDQSQACTERALSGADRLGYGFPIALANLSETLIKQNRVRASIAPPSAALLLGRRYSHRDVLVALQVIVGLAAALGEWPVGTQLYG
jgi:hypothetical protein